MKYFKPAITALSMVAISHGAIAASTDDNWVDVYGKVMLTLDSVNDANGDERWELNSNATRFGVKGFGDSGVEGVEVFYTMEWAVDITDESKEDNFTSRNQYIGLRGRFGEVLAGRSNTPTKTLVKEIDLFNDFQMEFKTSFNAEKRMSDIVQYKTPKLGGFTAKIALVPGEETNVSDAVSTSFEYKSGNYTFGMSFDDGIEGEDVTTLRGLAKFNSDNWQVGLMYQDTDNLGNSADGMIFSTRYKIGKHALKVQLVESDVWQAGVSSKVIYTSQQIIGWDYKASKKTTFLTYLSNSEEGASGENDSVFGVGIVQKF